jgi:hypothetical protein
MFNGEILLNLSFFSYFIFTVLTINFRRNKFNTLTSPYIIFTGSNLLVVVGCYTIGNIMHYYPISSILLLFTVFVSLLFFIVESSVLSLKNNINKPYVNFINCSSRFLENISLICISIELLILFRLIGKYGPFGLITKQFTDVYAHGLSGHILVFLQLSTIYYIGNIEKIQSKIICIIILILELLVGIFHWVAFPIVAGIVFRLMLRKMKITLAKILFIGLLAVVLFVASYGIFIIFSSKNNNRQISNTTFHEIFGYTRHFFNYLFSGTLGGSAKIESGIVMNKQGIVSLLTIFVPVYNILHILSGGFFSIEYYESIIERQNKTVKPGWNITISDLGFKTNVEGIFGGLYLNNDILYIVLFIIMISMISSILFFCALNFKTIFTKLYYSFFSVGLFFSWFTSFYHTLEFYEIAGYVLFLYLGDKYMSRKTIKIFCS